MLFEFYKNKFIDNVLLEADDDQQTDTPPATPTPPTQPENQTTQEQPEEDDDENYDMGDDEDGLEGEDQPEDQTTQEQPEEDDDENYDMGDDEDGLEGEDQPEDQTTQDDIAQQSNENDPRQKLRDLEASIFDQLSDEQKKLKVGELKELYTDTYEKAKSISTMVSELEKSPEHAKIYDYILNALADLRKYIQDYLNNVFDSKTYIENLVEFQKYLTIFDTVNNIFIDLRDNKDEK